MKNKVVTYVNKGIKLDFDPVTGFAINPMLNTAVFSADYRDILLTAVGTGTVVVYGSCQKDPPDFTSASTITNSYVPIVLADYALVNTYYAGTAGITVAGATKIVELNTNLLTWVAFHRSVNTVDILLTETDAQ